MADVVRRIPGYELYMGWVIQPVREGLFYVYERSDTNGANGHYYEGTWERVWGHVDSLVRREEV